MIRVSNLVTILSPLTEHYSTNTSIHTMSDHESVIYDPIVFRVTPKIHFKLSQLKYVTFTMIGIALLWPWNCFLSASEYYAERFSDTPGLIKVYTSTMMSVSTVASTIYNYYLSQVQTGVNYTYRINLGLSLTVVVFIVMAISCVSDFFIRMLDPIFFTILMSMVLISATATCLAQNGTMATVNVLGGIYANAVMVGQAVAGVLPACALIISTFVMGEKPKNEEEGKYYVEKNYGVFVYYITASLVSIVSMLLLFWSNYHLTEANYRALDEIMEEPSIVPEPHPLMSSLSQEPMIQSKYVPFSVLWSKLKLIVLTIFLNFCVTLVFPVFASCIESTHTDSTSIFFQKKIFIPFIYLTWNIGDLLGRILCGYPKLGLLITNPRTLVIYAVSRVVFIPLFLTCNVHPFSTKSHESNALINSDVWYILLQLLFGISNGQLCTSCFMIVGDYCDNDDEKEAAGGFTTVFLSVGLAVGSLLSYLLVLYIN